MEKEMLRNGSTPVDAAVITILLVSLAALPMLQGVLLTPLLAVMKQAMGTQSSSTFPLRVMMAAPALAIVLLIPMLSRFADYFERRHILIIGLLLYALCGLAAFALPDIEYLVVSRLVLGCSLACIMTISVASVGDLFGAAERNRLLGLQYVASTLVGMLGPLLAGLIALVDWRLTFLLYLLPLLLLPLAARLPSLGQDRRAGLEPGSAFEIRPIIGILVLIGAGTTVLWLLTLQLAFHLADGGFSSPVFAGMALGTPCVSGIISGLLYPVAKRRLSLVAIAALAFSLMGVGYALIALATSVSILVAGLLVAGLGFGFNQPNCAAWLLSVANAQTRGRASAILTVATCVGQLASPIIYEPMVSKFGSAATFEIVAVTCAVVAGITCFVSAGSSNR
jgi:MFS family permease